MLRPILATARPIDGDALLDLMMRDKMGVRVERQIELLDLDQNYFEDVE